MKEEFQFISLSNKISALLIIKLSGLDVLVELETLELVLMALFMSSARAKKSKMDMLSISGMAQVGTSRNVEVFALLSHLMALLGSLPIKDRSGVESMANGRGLLDARERSLLDLTVTHTYLVVLRATPTMRTSKCLPKVNFVVIRAIMLVNSTLHHNAQLL